MKNFFTFINSSGDRQLRGYVKVALVLFVVLGTLIGVNIYTRSSMMAEVMATPRVVETTVASTTATVTDIPALTEVVETCPANPADWTLTADLAVPGSNLKGLAPQCVYDQLDKTAAWLYATSVLGYSRVEAANHFGFDYIPIFKGHDSITVLSALNDEPQKVYVDSPPKATKFKEWQILLPAGTPAVEMSFSGCFRTSSISGGQVSQWGEGYPVVCQYMIDQNHNAAIRQVDGYIYTMTATNPLHERRFFWFGYIGDGHWTHIGTAIDWVYDNTSLSPLANPINEKVMAEKYGLTVAPLPENWQSYTGEEAWTPFEVAWMQDESVTLRQTP